MRKFAAIAAILLGLAAFTPMENNGNSINGGTQINTLRDSQMSAANAAQTFVYDIGQVNTILAIAATCSAGTATLTVSGSSDDQNWVTIDSLSAAATNVENYIDSSTGGATAVSPLAFRWVKISQGACGSSNTGTLTVAGK